MSIEVVHIDCYDPVHDVLETLRVTSSEDYIANGYAYYPCLAEMLDFNAALFDKGTTGGAVTVGVGTIVLNNADGSLDRYVKHGFDGRTITVYKPRDKNDSATDETNLFFTGVVSYAEFGWDKLTIYVKSRLEALNVPMQPHGFLGTNVGAGGDGGFEGSDRLKGKIKPQIFGRCSSVEGIPINEFWLIYAFNYDNTGDFAPLHRVYNVYVKGIRYIYGQLDYADESQLMAADLSGLGPGYYVTCMNKGLIRLSSTPASNGAVVADVADASDQACSAAQVVSRILTQNSSFTAGADYDAGQLQELDAINSCPVGIAISDDTSIASAVNQILDSIGAWYVPDSTGVFRFGWIDMPDLLIDLGEVPVCTITKQQWEDTIEREAVQDDSQNIPAQSVELLHSRNWKTQESGSLADSVGLRMRMFFTEQYRSSRANKESITNAHPLAPSLTYKTLLNTGLDLPLINGDFSVEIGEPGGGWIVDGHAASYTQSGGVFEGSSADDFIYLIQSLVFGDDIHPGLVNLGFVNKGGFEVQVTVTASTAGTLLDQTIDATDEDNWVLLSFTVPEDAGDVTIQFSSVVAMGVVKISSVYLVMGQVGNSPDDEASRRLRVQSAFQEMYTLSIPIGFYKDNGIEIGKIVKLQDSRFGLEDGKAFIVVGVDPTDSEFKVSLDVWRAEEIMVAA